MNEIVGRKDDSGKLRYDLIPPEALEALTKVLMHGAEKYGDNNWKKGINYRRIYGAIQRHLQDWRKGQWIDTDSGLPGLWNAYAELTFLIYYEQNKEYAKFNDFRKEWNKDYED